ncbi:hypothetical protein [Nocardiopsis ansamitocini]|uniref:DUF3558 domain-containing protein n=1 Tax=Nocardiopsis ansamitocini TaxID=1670832 RepID=A0A9W6P6R0_9ACTN|nr:hypothetical protein [Nocardiopsis ansamitocini]GLU48023.1 hypothetical protein Nans01_23740 [Nocardiopsis ansamitocini]
MAQPPSGPQQPYEQQPHGEGGGPPEGPGGAYGHPQQPYGEQSYGSGGYPPPGSPGPGGAYGHPQQPYGEQSYGSGGYPPPGSPGPGGAYGHPQQPYGQMPYGGQPGYGGGFQPPPPAKSNGCLIGGIIGAVVVLLLVIGLVVVVVVGLSASDSSSGPSDSGTGTPEATYFSQLPGCEVFEGPQLEEIVPDLQNQTDEASDTEGEDWWEGRTCVWQTSPSSFERSGYVWAMVMRNDDEGLTSADQWAADDLALYAEDYPTTDVPGLGDGAVSWYDTDKKLGCVAAYVSNVSLATCYDSFTSAEDSIPEADAVASADELARAAMTAIEEGDYR